MAERPSGAPSMMRRKWTITSRFIPRKGFASVNLPARKLSTQKNTICLPNPLRRKAMLYTMLVRKNVMLSVAFRFCAIVFAVVAMVNSSAFAQEDVHESAAPVDVPGIFLEPINMSIGNPDSTRLDLYIQVPYQTLSFVKESGVFRASYDVTLELRDSADALVTEKLWTDNVQTNKYEETV